MRKPSISNTALAARFVRDLTCRHSNWVLAATFILVLIDSEQVTLFGVNAGESVKADFSFSPAAPTRLGGLGLLTYPLVHASGSHWVSGAVFWLFLSRLIETRFCGHGLYNQSKFIVAYGLVSAMIALSFLLPWAPVANVGDRILGLSAIVLFQTGFMIFVRPPPFFWWAVPTAVYTLYFSAAESALAQWGHGAGFILGLTIGAVLRFGYPRSIEIFS